MFWTVWNLKDNIASHDEMKSVFNCLKKYSKNFHLDVNKKINEMWRSIGKGVLFKTFDVKVQVHFVPELWRQTFWKVLLFLWNVTNITWWRKLMMIYFQGNLFLKYAHWSFPTFNWWSMKIDGWDVERQRNVWTSWIYMQLFFIVNHHKIVIIDSKERCFKIDKSSKIKNMWRFIGKKVFSRRWRTSLRYETYLKNLYEPTTL